MTYRTLYDIICLSDRNDEYIKTERQPEGWKVEKMKRYGEEFKLTDELMTTIASYMDDEIREDLHQDIAPCSNEEFITRYVERDKDFAELLENEFGIEI